MSEKSKFDMFGLWIHVQCLLFLSLLGLVLHLVTSTNWIYVLMECQSIFCAYTLDFLCVYLHQFLCVCLLKAMCMKYTQPEINIVLTDIFFRSFSFLSLFIYTEVKTLHLCVGRKVLDFICNMELYERNGKKREQCCLFFDEYSAVLCKLLQGTTRIDCPKILIAYVSQSFLTHCSIHNACFVANKVIETQCGSRFGNYSQKLCLYWQPYWQ